MASSQRPQVCLHLLWQFAFLEHLFWLLHLVLHQSAGFVSRQEDPVAVTSSEPRHTTKMIARAGPFGKTVMLQGFSSNFEIQLKRVWDEWQLWRHVFYRHHLQLFTFIKSFYSTSFFQANIGAQILVFKQVQVFSESQIVLKGGVTCEFGSRARSYGMHLQITSIPAFIAFAKTFFFQVPIHLQEIRFVLYLIHVTPESLDCQKHSGVIWIRHGGGSTYPSSMTPQL